jgi:hypothetical protein
MMSEAGNQAPVPDQSFVKHRGWIVYFAFLVVASVGVTTWMIYFNLSIQLTPEQLAAAESRWQEKGPRDYKLFYTERVNDDPQPITYAVTVKDGKVTDARKNGKAIETDEDYRMNGLLAKAARALQDDREPGAKKVYTIARFDDKTGALLYYVRRVMGTTDRLEIAVKCDWMEK